MTRIDRGFRLASDSEDPGLKCTSQGLSLAGAPLLCKTAAGFAPRSADEVGALLKAAYGEGIDPAGLAPGLDVIAKALNQGDLGRAMIAALHLRLPGVGSDAIERIAKVEGALVKYDSNELRDERGRWATGDTGPAGSSTPDLGHASNEVGASNSDRPILIPVSDRVYPNVTAFRNQHLADAIKLAAVIGHGATADEVLAVAGKESKYGIDYKAKIHGNYFGIHSHGTDPANYLPGQIGAIPTARDGPVATFSLEDAFYRSGLIFANKMAGGAGNRNLSDPMIFFSLAHSIAWGTTTPKYISEIMNVYGLFRNSARASERRS